MVLSIGGNPTRADEAVEVEVVIVEQRVEYQGSKHRLLLLYGSEADLTSQLIASRTSAPRHSSFAPGLVT